MCFIAIHKYIWCFNRLKKCSHVLGFWPKKIRVVWLNIFLLFSTDTFYENMWYDWSPNIFLLCINTVPLDAVSRCQKLGSVVNMTIFPRPHGLLHRSLYDPGALVWLCYYHIRWCTLDLLYEPQLLNIYGMF